LITFVLVWFTHFIGETLAANSGMSRATVRACAVEKASEYSEHEYFLAVASPRPDYSPIGGYLEAEISCFILDFKQEHQQWLIERKRLFDAVITLTAWAAAD
jgi:hypothetical protein